MVNTIESARPDLVGYLADKLSSSMSVSSKKSIEWRCPRGHVWAASPNSMRRLHRTEPCPYCAGVWAVRGVDDMMTMLPELYALWNVSRNAKIDVSHVRVDSATPVWWVCDRGHEWKASVKSLATIHRDVLCPYCSYRLPLKGWSDLATTNPALMLDWNDGMDPSTLTRGSNRKASWKCHVCGHEWSAVIQSRAINGNGCPACAHRVTVRGSNDLASYAPWLLDELDDDSFDPGAESRSSERTVHWKCSKCGHEWDARISNRVNGTGCPACSRIGKATAVGVNDFASLFPDAAREAVGVDMTKVRVRSNRRILWKCSKCGYEWHATPDARSLGHGCPACSGRVAVPGKNDLATLRPDIAAEWDYKKNIGIQPPSEMKIGAEKKVWWICSKCGYSWNTWVYKRTEGSQCPKCFAGSHKSSEEVAAFIESIVGSKNIIRNDTTVLDGKELDIYVPSCNFACEYNGIHWHTEGHGRDRNYHYNKYNMCKDKNIRLLQIWDDDWRSHKNVVKDHIRNILNDSNHIIKYDARKCVIRNLSVMESDMFLMDNHIQGTHKSSIRMGLVYNDKVVAVLSCIIRENGDIEITRYVTRIGCVVRGGFSKLLSHIPVSSENKRIITFSDNMVSDGGLYAANGFTVDRILPPDYMIVRNGCERFHKLLYRKDRFRTDPELEYRDGLTEAELDALNGLDRVWDAGKVRWVR